MNNKIPKNMTCMVACIILFSTLYARPSDQHSSEDWVEFLHEQMLEFTRSEHIPNAVISLVKHGDIQMLRGYGFANLEMLIPIDPDANMFRAGSVSKIFTWLSIMQLYERGLIGLDDPISQYLEEDMTLDIRYRGNAEQPITIMDLMNHTAGFANTFEGLFSFTRQPSLEEYLQNNRPSLIHPPGQVIGYSNYGSALAGFIVEKVSGLSFEAYVEQYIFNPLQMRNSSFRQPLQRAHRELLVGGYRWSDGAFDRGHFEHMVAPAGGISSSARDMAQLMIAMLDQGADGRLLQPQTMGKMLTTSFSYHPLTDGIAHGLMESRFNGHRIIGHSGSSTLFDAGFYLLPDHDTGIYIAYSGGDQNGHTKIFHAFIQAFFDHTTANDIQTSPAPYQPRLSKVKGEYQHSLPITKGLKKVLNLFFGSMQVKTTGDGLLEVDVYGQSFGFKQTEPGIFKNTSPNHLYPHGNMQYLVATRSPGGRLMLVTDGPASFIKTSWFERGFVALLVFVPALLLALGSLFFFLIRFIMRKLRKQPAKSSTWKATNYLIITHGIGLLLVLLLFMNFAEPHPVHLLPMSFFESFGSLLTLLGLISWLMAALSVVLVILVVRAWKKQEGKPKVRIYYSVYTLWALALGWLLYFYQFMGI